MLPEGSEVVQISSELARLKNFNGCLQMSGVGEIRYRKFKSIARSGCVAPEHLIGKVYIRSQGI